MMAIESKIPPQDQLFDDNFDLLGGVSLSELYIDTIRRQWGKRGHEGTFDPSQEPWPIYAASEKVDVPELGICLRPETFHQAFDFEATSQEVIETTTAHHQQLRDIGIKVVGHTFEAIEDSSDDLQINGRYPTILVGAKYLTRNRLTDQPENEAADMGEFSDYIDHEALDMLDDTVKEGLIDTMRQYLEWCKESKQPYVLRGLHELSNYTPYHPRHQVVGFQGITSRLGRVDFKGNFAPVGNLWSAARDFEYFVKTLTGREEGLSV